MKLSKTLFILPFFSLISCKKEVIEKQETIEKTVFVPVEGSYIIDTVVSTPNFWQIKRSKNEHWQRIEHDSIKLDRAIDVYLGVKNIEWLNLPYVNVQDNITINYFWRNGQVVLMAYGDSTILNSNTYWQQFKSDIKIKVSKKL